MLCDIDNGTFYRNPNIPYLRQGSDHPLWELHSMHLQATKWYAVPRAPSAPFPTRLALAKLRSSTPSAARSTATSLAGRMARLLPKHIYDITGQRLWPIQHIQVLCIHGHYEWATMLWKNKGCPRLSGHIIEAMAKSDLSSGDWPDRIRRREDWDKIAKECSDACAVSAWAWFAHHQIEHAFFYQQATDSRKNGNLNDTLECNPGKWALLWKRMAFEECPEIDPAVNGPVMAPLLGTKSKAILTIDILLVDLCNHVLTGCIDYNTVPSEFWENMAFIHISKQEARHKTKYKRKGKLPFLLENDQHCNKDGAPDDPEILCKGSRRIHDAICRNMITTNYVVYDPLTRKAVQSIPCKSVHHVMDGTKCLVCSKSQPRSIPKRLLPWLCKLNTECRAAAWSMLTGRPVPIIEPLTWLVARRQMETLQRFRIKPSELDVCMMCCLNSRDISRQCGKDKRPKTFYDYVVGSVVYRSCRYCYQEQGIQGTVRRYNLMGVVVWLDGDVGIALCTECGQVSTITELTWTSTLEDVRCIQCRKPVLNNASSWETTYSKKVSKKTATSKKLGHGDDGVPCPHPSLDLDLIDNLFMDADDIENLMRGDNEEQQQQEQEEEEEYIFKSIF